MSNLIVDYHPTAKQRLYHKSKADELLYGGAAGGGKSTATVMEAFKLCMMYPGVQTYLFRRTYPELEKSLLIEAYKHLSGIGRYSAQKHEWVFPNGSKMVFCHCQYAKDRYNYQGAEINALFIDELTHFTREIYDYLKTRVRAAKSLNFRPRANCTSNPGGIGHAWVKERFADLEPYVLHEDAVKLRTTGETMIKTRQYIPAKVTDNPHIDDGYVFELEQKPENLRRALLEGRWDAFEGQVFYEWTNDIEHYTDHHKTHVIAPFEIPRGWARFRAFDWGYSKPFACIWAAVDQDDRIYIYREWYGASAADVGIKMSVPEVAKGIAAREQNDGEVIGYADPAIWDCSTGESVAEQLALNGVYFNKGDNARLAGKMQIHNRLRFDSNGIPMIYVFSSCVNVIRTLPALVYSEIKVEDVDTATEDHLYDALRYLCMSHPLGNAPPPEKQKRVYDPFSTGNYRGSGYLSL